MVEAQETHNIEQFNTEGFTVSKSDDIILYGEGRRKSVDDIILYGEGRRKSV